MSSTQAGPSITEILDQLLEVRTVEAAVVIARDGFPMEHAGRRVADLNALAFSVSEMMDGVERMNEELELTDMGIIVVEYKRNLVVCEPITKEVVLAVLTSDPNALGVVRFYSKRLSPLMQRFY